MDSASTTPSHNGQRPPDGQMGLFFARIYPRMSLHSGGGAGHEISAIPAPRSHPAEQAGPKPVPGVHGKYQRHHHEIRITERAMQVMAVLTRDFRLR